MKKMKTGNNVVLLMVIFIFVLNFKEGLAKSHSKALKKKLQNLTNIASQTMDLAKVIKSEMTEEEKEEEEEEDKGVGEGMTNTYLILPYRQRGDDERNNKKSLQKKYQTVKSIEECLTKVNPGDRCLMKTAAYNDSVTINNLHGKPNAPIVIGGDDVETPVLGGAEVITVDKWVTDDGKIYKGKVQSESPIWQLFINGDMMTNARWPNAKWTDKSIFDGKLWSKFDAGTQMKNEKNKNNNDEKKKSVVVDSNLRQLSELNIDGAMAVLNIGSYCTFVSKVENFNGNGFEFEDTFGKYHYKRKNCRYFLEDKLELLDQHEEWFYNQTTRMLYVYPPKNVDLNKAEILGKVKTYSITIKKSSNLIFKNLRFFATTLQIENSDNITVESSNFMYPSYSKRMLGNSNLIEWTKIDGDSENIKFINNKFFGSDGTVLYGGKKATGTIVENNLFEFNDWSGANMIKGMGGMATVKTDGDGTIMRRNTLNFNGGNVGLRPGKRSTVTMNRIRKQCFGVIQNDGAGIQLQKKPQRKSQITFNWVYDSPKYALRFDGELPNPGLYGNISYNVAWKCNGIMVKGDYHTANYNLAFDKRNAKDDDEQGKGCTFCVIAKLRNKEGIMNNHTEVYNNAADVANGGVNVKDRKHPLDFSAILSNNLFNEEFNANDFVDLKNFDFRPMPGSLTDQKGAGPYGLNNTEYLIPGRQRNITSFPIPPDGATDIIPERRRVLIWMNAYKCQEHHIFFGVDQYFLEYLGNVTGNVNMIQLPVKLDSGMTYYWRVDAVCDENENKESGTNADKPIIEPPSGIKIATSKPKKSSNEFFSTKRGPEDSRVSLNNRTGDTWQFKTK